MAETSLQIKMVVEVGIVSSEVQTAMSTPPTTTASTTGSKTSLFVKKAGFVIPKNRRSGSLVPAFRVRKPDSDLVNEEVSTPVQRKTKWGPDLNVDSSVRKGRSLAYQTRLNQISEQLTIGNLDLEDNTEFSTSESQHGKKSNIQLSNEESELLVHERREIIGEILKLNPAYKAPSDYKPPMKESKVPIPIKEHPGHNFIGSLFSTTTDTLKRLERETGARVKVYGVKADAGGKVEITTEDGNERSDAYEEMYVHVSADSFEKVDTAVSLVELLLTSVSVNPPISTTTVTVSMVSDDKMTTQPSTGGVSSVVASPTNPGLTQSYTGSSLPAEGRFPHYPPQPWLPAGPTQGPSFLQSGFAANSSSTPPSLIGTHLQVSTSPLNPSNLPPVSGLRPPAMSPNIVVSASQNPSVVLPIPQLRPYMQQQAPSLAQTGVLMSTPPLPLLSAPPRVPSPNMRPPLHWPSPQAAVAASISQGTTNLMSTAAMVAPPSVGHNAISAGTASRGGFTSLYPLEPAPSTTQPSSVGPVQLIPHGAVRGATPGPAPMLFQQANPRPLQQSSNDFTFQPNHPPVPAAPQVWQSRQPPLPLVRPMVQNLNHSPIQVFPRLQLQINNQADQPRLQMRPTFLTGRPQLPRQVVPPPRHHPALPVHNMHPRHFIPPNPVNQVFPRMQQIQENYHPLQRFSSPHPQKSRPFHPMMGHGQARYEPLNHTNMSSQMGGKPVRVPSESDPEYEDLMASVGVK